MARRQCAQLACLLACACSSAPGLAEGRSASAAPPAARFAGIDRAVAPGDDFFSYANGGWLRDAQIPLDHDTYGINDELQDLADRRTADLIRAAAASPAAAGTDERRVGDYFAAYMDERAVESKGIGPLRPALDTLAAIDDRAELARALGASLRADVDVLNATNLHTPNILGLWVAQDLDEPSRCLPFLLQGGLGMPDRAYYLDETAAMAKVRASYRQHIAAVLALAGEPAAQARAQAERIFALETGIARVHASPADTNDVKKGDNHWRREQLITRAPGIDWPAFLESAGLGRQEEFVVWQPQALVGIAALVGSEPLSTWRAYLRFHLLDRAAEFLPRAFVDEDFHFYGRVLSGTPRIRDRWKRAVAAADRDLGEAVGRLYVGRYFPASERERARRMVQDVIAAFASRIDRLAWMAPETRRMAKAKLAALKVSVGYPDRWRDDSTLAISRNDALGNHERAEMFEYRRNLAKLGRAADRDEWVMNPQLNNAVNLPVLNVIQFPAAGLQPPLFSPDNTAAMNYGAAGATIGHEISHGFDDQGALFDAQGRLRNWWMPQDLEHFTAAGRALVRQFDAYRPFPDLAVNGRQTLSENIADLAGLAMAYDAWRASLSGAEPPVVDGLTGEQQFFLSFAQSWREKDREAALRRQLIVDEHAPARYRAQTVRNIDAWYRAFDVKPGQALYLAPGDRVRIW